MGSRFSNPQVNVSPVQQQKSPTTSANLGDIVNNPNGQITAPTNEPNIETVNMNPSQPTTSNVFRGPLTGPMIKNTPGLTFDQPQINRSQYQGK